MTLEQGRAQPAGITLSLATRHHKHTELRDGIPVGFRTPSGKVELLSETLAEHGYPALPTFTEPAISPRSRPDLAGRYPLVLTCAKSAGCCRNRPEGKVSELVDESAVVIATACASIGPGSPRGVGDCGPQLQAGWFAVVAVFLDVGLVEREDMRERSLASAGQRDA